MEMFNPPHTGEILREDCLKPLSLTATAAAKGLGVSRGSLGLAPRSPGCAINCPTISGMRAGAPEESRSSLFPRLRPNRIEDRAAQFTVTASRQQVVADDFVDGPRAGVG